MEILTLDDAVALSTILRAAQGSHPVEYYDADSATVMRGQCQCITTESGALLSSDVDVRTGTLRVTLYTGHDTFLPIENLIQSVKRGEFYIVG